MLIAESNIANQISGGRQFLDKGLYYDIADLSLKTYATRIGREVVSPLGTLSPREEVVAQMSRHAIIGGEQVDRILTDMVWNGLVREQKTSINSPVQQRVGFDPIDVMRVGIYLWRGNKDVPAEAALPRWERVILSRRRALGHSPLAALLPLDQEKAWEAIGNGIPPDKVDTLPNRKLWAMRERLDDVASHYPKWPVPLRFLEHQNSNVAGAIGLSGVELRSLIRELRRQKIIRFDKVINQTHDVEPGLRHEGVRAVAHIRHVLEEMHPGRNYDDFRDVAWEDISLYAHALLSEDSRARRRIILPSEVQAAHVEQLPIVAAESTNKLGSDGAIFQKPENTNAATLFSEDTVMQTISAENVGNSGDGMEALYALFDTVTVPTEAMRSDGAFLRDVFVESGADELKAQQELVTERVPSIVEGNQSADYQETIVLSGSTPETSSPDQIFSRKNAQLKKILDRLHGWPHTVDSVIGFGERKEEIAGILEVSSEKLSELLDLFFSRGILDVELILSARETMLPGLTREDAFALIPLAESVRTLVGDIPVYLIPDELLSDVADYAKGLAGLHFSPEIAAAIQTPDVLPTVALAEPLQPGVPDSSHQTGKEEMTLTERLKARRAGDVDTTVFSQLTREERIHYESFVREIAEGRKGIPRIPSELVDTLLAKYSVSELVTLYNKMKDRNVTEGVNFKRDVDLANFIAIRYIAWRKENLATKDFVILPSRRDNSSALFAPSVRVASEMLVELQKTNPHVSLRDLY